MVVFPVSKNLILKQERMLPPSKPFWSRIQNICVVVQWRLKLLENAIVTAYLCMQGGHPHRKRQASASDKENLVKKPKPLSEDSKGVVGSGRGVAQGKNYKEDGLVREEIWDKIEVVDAKDCASEKEAIEDTGAASEKERRYSSQSLHYLTGVNFTLWCHFCWGSPAQIALSCWCKNTLLNRLQYFEFHDDTGNLQPLCFKDLTGQPLYISGTVHPVHGLVSKKNGRSTSSFGPVLTWNILYSKTDFSVSAAHVWLSSMNDWGLLSLIASCANG